MAVVAATVLLLGSVLTAPSMRWIHAEGPAVWMLRLLTLAQLLLGAAWTLRAAARRHRLGRWSCALVPPALHKHVQVVFHQGLELPTPEDVEEQHEGAAQLVVAHPVSLSRVLRLQHPRPVPQLLVLQTVWKQTRRRY